MEVSRFYALTLGKAPSAPTRQKASRDVVASTNAPCSAGYLHSDHTVTNN